MKYKKYKTIMGTLLLLSLFGISTISFAITVSKAEQEKFNQSSDIIKKHDKKQLFMLNIIRDISPLYKGLNQMIRVNPNSEKALIDAQYVNNSNEVDIHLTNLDRDMYELLARMKMIEKVEIAQCMSSLACMKQYHSLG